MAYCPKCKKVVEERWIECPVCRTPVVPDERYARRDESRTLNKMPGVQARKEYNFPERVAGVLKFDRRVLESMAIRHYILEVFLLYAAGNVLYLFIPASPYAGFFGMDFLSNTSPFVFAVKLLTAFVGVAIAAGSIQFALKVFGGHESFATTLAVMLYVAAVWGIAMNAVSFVLEVLLTPVFGTLVALLSVELAALFFVFLILAGWVVAFSVVHDMSSVMAVVSVLAGLALFLAVLTGTFMALSAALEIIMALPPG